MSAPYSKFESRLGTWATALTEAELYAVLTNPPTFEGKDPRYGPNTPDGKQGPVIYPGLPAFSGCLYANSKRVKENVCQLGMAVIDFDGGDKKSEPEGTWEKVVFGLHELDLKFWVKTSASHTKTAQRLHVGLFFEMPLVGNVNLIELQLRKLVSLLETKLNLVADKGSYEPGKLVFFGKTAATAHDYNFYHTDGQCVDVVFSSINEVTYTAPLVLTHVAHVASGFADEQLAKLPNTVSEKDNVLWKNRIGTFVGAGCSDEAIVAWSNRNPAHNGSDEREARNVLKGILNRSFRPGCLNNLERWVVQQDEAGVWGGDDVGRTVSPTSFLNLATWTGAAKTPHPFLVFLGGSVTTGTETTRAHSNQGNQLRLDDRHRENVLRTNDTNTTYLWDESRWATDCPSQSLMLKLAGELHHIVQAEREVLAKQRAFKRSQLPKVVPGMEEEEEKKVQAALDKFDKSTKAIMVSCNAHALRCGSLAERKSAIEGFLSMPEVRLSEADLDCDPLVVGFDEGRQVIDLATQTFRAAKQSDRITKSLGTDRVGYTSEAVLWTKAMTDWFPKDPETIAYIQMFCGYMLSGTVEAERALVLLGDGSNGKSVFVAVLRALMGKYGASPSTATIAEAKHARSGSETSSDIIALINKRGAFYAEVSGKMTLDSALYKKVVSGDGFSARDLGDKTQEFKMCAKNIIMGNSLMKMDLADKAMARRTTPILFGQDFSVLFDDKLTENLIEELPHILRWCLDGYGEYLAKGRKAALVAMPATSKALVEEMISGADPLNGFFAACCIAANNEETDSALVYAAYGEHNEAQGVRQNMTKKLFTAELQRKGVGQRKSNSKVFYTNLRLNTDFESLT